MFTRKETPKNEAKKSIKNNGDAPMQTSCCSPVGVCEQETKPNEAKSKKGADKTRITIKYDVGYPNQLFIRGKGANLSWEKGQLLKNIKHDEWVWESESSFNDCEFKILINDRVYENGENHRIAAGETMNYSPHFF